MVIFARINNADKEYDLNDANVTNVLCQIKTSYKRKYVFLLQSLNMITLGQKETYYNGVRLMGLQLKGSFG